MKVYYKNGENVFTVAMEVGKDIFRANTNLYIALDEYIGAYESFQDGRYIDAAGLAAFGLAMDINVPGKIVKAGIKGVKAITKIASLGENIGKITERNTENIVYRALNPIDVKNIAEGRGIIAKNPDGNWMLDTHILEGSNPSSRGADPYIATTKDVKVAEFFNNVGDNLGIVTIDLNKIKPASIFKSYEIFPRSSGQLYNNAVWQQEISIKENIPMDAIIDFRNILQKRK